MGKIELFSIEFQKQDATFLAGEAVVGSVNIEVKERLKINGVRIIIIGGAQFRW